MSETAREQHRSSIVMGHNNYGKSDVRLVKVFRDSERHEIKDLRVDVSQEGGFAAAHTEGDNTDLMATDTMRNTVYALASDRLTGSIEEFGIELARHFLEVAPRVRRVRIRLVEHPWSRIEVDGRPHEHSFVRGAGCRTASVEGEKEGGGGGFCISAGLDDLLVLKTTNSGWEGFLHDRYTTLPETDDRILATVVSAEWSYDTPDVDYDATWRGVRDQILATFTDHYSPSVQNTLYRMGEAVLKRFPEVGKVHFSLPNKHHLPYDLSRFGLENQNEMFHASAEPYGLIEGTVERSDTGEEGAS